VAAEDERQNLRELKQRGAGTALGSDRPSAEIRQPFRGDAAAVVANPNFFVLFSLSP
jgi:predicted amidohydrolase YtcJ